MSSWRGLRRTLERNLPQNDRRMTSHWVNMLVARYRVLPLLIFVLPVTGCTKSDSDLSKGSASSAEDIVAEASPLVDDELELELPLVNANPGYVGVQTCAECHSSRFHEFQQTRHYVAAAEPSEELMPPGFDHVKVSIPKHLPGVEFLMSREKSSFLQSLVHPPAETSHAQPLTIGLGYGLGGKADEVYFAWQGNRLRELPLGWLHPSGEWGAQQFTSPDGPPDYTRVATTRCLECHTTWYEHRKGTDNEYRPSSFLMGVTCERCHGPGEEHVEHHRQHPGDTQARSVVHPGLLSRERQMDLCGQCHSNGIFRRTDLFSYRPGDDLQDHFRQHLNPNFEDDNVANQVKYLKQSRCYQNSETLTCVSCHSPHHVQTASEQGFDSCRTCHQPSDCAERPNLPAGLNDQCADCHMPKYARLAVRFHTRDDRYVFPVRPTKHRIAVYPEARDELLLGWHEQQLAQDIDQTEQSRSEHQQSASRLRSSLAAHWLNQAQQYGEQYRFIAAIGAAREASRWDSTGAAAEQLEFFIDRQTTVEREFAGVLRLQQQGQFVAASEVCERILRIKPNHAITLGKLGTFQAVLGDEAAAEVSLQKSALSDPDNSYADNMLGWLAFLRGDHETAIEHFRKAEDIYPYTAENNYRWGLALNAAARWKEAHERLQLAISIAPNDPNISLALSQTCRELGDNQNALKYSYRAARLTEFRDLQSLEWLAAEYRAAGQTENAAEVINQALSLPEADEPSTRQNLLRQRAELTIK